MSSRHWGMVAIGAILAGTVTSARADLHSAEAAYANGPYPDRAALHFNNAADLNLLRQVAVLAAARVAADALGGLLGRHREDRVREVSLAARAVRAHVVPGKHV